MKFGLRDLLFEVVEDATTSIASDISDLSEGEDLGEVKSPNSEESEEESTPLDEQEEVSEQEEDYDYRQVKYDGFIEGHHFFS